MTAFYNALYKYVSPIFGYIMLFFFGFFDGVRGGYGIAIILFTIVARFFMIPTTLSQQKNMAKQQRLAPKIKRIQEKYAGNQQKIQEETQNLYAREGFNPMSSGCLPLLIQLPIIAGLFGVLYNPLMYAIGLKSGVSDAFIEVFKTMVNGGLIEGIKANQERYFPLYIIEHFKEVTAYISQKGITTVTPDAIAKVQAFVDNHSFEFLGLQLGVVPSFKEFNKYWLIPILAGVTSLASALITQAQQKKTNPSQNLPGMGCTMLMMPAMSVYFTFLFPSGIGVYWIVSNIFATAQSLVMKKVYSPQKNIAKLMVAETVERRSRENSVKLINK